MIGPVVYLELLLSSRRGRQYVFRWIYAGWLLLQLLAAYLLYSARLRASFWETGQYNTNLTGEFAGEFVELFVVQQLILLLLATPAFAAGAITDEKSRGTLQYLLSADVSSPDIILGKLLGRTALVALLALTGLPVLCFFGVFGGLQPGLLFAVLAMTVAPLFALGAASLLASVWCRQTRDAVLSVYAAGAVGVFLVWSTRSLLPALDGIVQAFNPLYVLEPAWGDQDLERVLHRLLASLAAWGSLGLVCLGLAIGRLRGVYFRQLEGAGKPPTPRWWHARATPLLDRPIQWKESHVEGIAPLLALRRLPRWLGVVLIGALTLFSSASILWAHRPPGASIGQVTDQVLHFDVKGLEALVARSAPSARAFLSQGIIVLLLASLIVGIRCSGSVSGERERQTWEALLLTPLETGALIRGKLWGIIEASMPYLLAYAVPAVALAPLGGGLAFFWTLLWLAATLLAMYFVGAAGMWCSVRCKSSWKSLLATLGFGYLAGYVICSALASIPIVVLTVIIWAVLEMVDAFYGTASVQAAGGVTTIFNAVTIASSLGLAASFFLAARFLLARAEEWVAQRERVRFWEDEPILRHRRYLTAPLSRRS